MTRRLRTGPCLFDETILGTFKNWSIVATKLQVSKFLDLITKFLGLITKFLSLITKFPSLIAKFLSLITKFLTLITKFVSLMVFVKFKHIISYIIITIKICIILAESEFYL